MRAPLRGASERQWGEGGKEAIMAPCFLRYTVVDPIMPGMWKQSGTTEWGGSEKGKGSRSTINSNDM